jgi:hypothetical protein
MTEVTGLHVVYVVIGVVCENRIGDWLGHGFQIPNQGRFIIAACADMAR